MNKLQRLALARVIDYLWADEEKGYTTDPSPNHVFGALRELRPLVEPELDDLGSAACRWMFPACLAEALESLLTSRDINTDPSNRTTQTAIQRAHDAIRNAAPVA